MRGDREWIAWSSILIVGFIVVLVLLVAVTGCDGLGVNKLHAAESGAAGIGAAVGGVLLFTPGVGIIAGIVALFVGLFLSSPGTTAVPVDAAGNAVKVYVSQPFIPSWVWWLVAALAIFMIWPLLKLFARRYREHVGAALKKLFTGKPVEAAKSALRASGALHTPSSRVIHTKP